jgi:polar amino acid transport system substrate-binding protein
MTAFSATRPRLAFLLAVGVAAAAIAGPSAASADLLATIKEKGTFTAGTEARFPPFEQVENGEIVGYSQDIMDIIMQDPELEGVTLERLDLPWQGILPGLAAERFDYVITSVTATKERYDAYHMSVPIADATVAVLKRADDDSITGAEDLAGKTVGSQTGSAQFAALEKLGAELEEAGTPLAGTRDYVDFNEAYADLATGRIDAVVNSLPNLLEAVRQRPEVFAVAGETFGPKKYFSWAGRKDEDAAALNALIDRHLAAMIEDGTLSTLQTKWFGGPMELPTELPVPTE